MPPWGALHSSAFAPEVFFPPPNLDLKLRVLRTKETLISLVNYLIYLVAGFYLLPSRNTILDRGELVGFL